MIAGVIVELNPFHAGHSTHIAETRKLTNCKHIIAVMSGNFVQRGEPAICDKWQRTKMALLHGVDVVIELPVPYVISGADYFARGSVELLEATGVVDALCFGSESGNLQQIVAAGDILAQEPPLYKEILRNGLDRGLSFAAARGRALETCLGQVQDGLLTKPNNGLAMEYCKAVRLLGSKMQVFTTHRQSGGPSATKIRKAITSGEDLQSVRDFLPEMIRLILGTNKKFATLDDFSLIFKYLLYTKPQAVANLGEGLGNRFRRLCGEHSQISELLAAVKTKRYTFTRLQREILKLLLDVPAGDMDMYEKNGGVQYIRILGFRKDAAGVVGEITKKASLPVITHGAAMDRLTHDISPAAKMMLQEFYAGDIYRLVTGESGDYLSERGKKIIIV